MNKLLLFVFILTILSLSVDAAIPNRTSYPSGNNANSANNPFGALKYFSMNSSRGLDFINTVVNDSFPANGICHNCDGSSFLNSTNYIGNSSFQTDGVDDNLNTTDFIIAEKDAYSITFWINKTETRNTRGWFGAEGGQGAPGNSQVLFRQDTVNNRFRFFCNDGAGAGETNVNFPGALGNLTKNGNNSHHIAFVKQAGDCRIATVDLYIDAILMEKSGVDGGDITNKSTIYPIAFGDITGQGNQESFNVFDEILIFRRAIGYGEIITLNNTNYTAEAPPSDTTAPNITLINFTSDGGTSCLNNSIIFPTNCANTTDLTPTFSITSDEISACRMGVGTEVIYSSLNISCSAAVGNLTHTCTQPTALPFGWHNFNFICLDAAGNNQSLPLPTNFKANLTITNVPTVLYNSPAVANGTNSTYDFIYANFTATTPIFNITNTSVRLYDAAGALFSFNSSLTFSIFVNFSGLPDNNYTINATAIDSGNFSNSSVSRTILIDRTAPRVNFTIFTTNAGNQSNPYINITVESGDVHYAITNITFWDSLGTYGTFLNSSSGSTSLFSVNTSFPNGLFSVNVTARDTFGNQNVTETRNYTIDSTPPNVSIFFINSTPINASNFTNSGVIQINATLNDTLTTVTDVRFGIFNPRNNSEFNLTTIKLGSFWTQNITLSFLTDAQYVIRVYGNDTLGNLNNSVSNLSFIVDTTPPNVSIFIMNVSNGSTFTNSGVIQINATLNDTLTTVTHVKFGILNTANATELNFTAIKLGSFWTQNISLSSLTDATYTIRIYGNDTLGNLNNSVSNLSFIVSGAVFPTTGAVTKVRGAVGDDEWLFAPVTSCDKGMYLSNGVCYLLDRSKIQKIKDHLILNSKRLIAKLKAPDTFNLSQKIMYYTLISGGMVLFLSIIWYSLLKPTQTGVKNMAKKNMLEMLAAWLLVLGGLNWGLVGLLNLNLVEKLPLPLLVKLLYVLIGASALVALWSMLKGDE